VARFLTSRSPRPRVGKDEAEEGIALFLAKGESLSCVYVDASMLFLLSSFLTSPVTFV